MACILARNRSCLSLDFPLCRLYSLLSISLLTSLPPAIIIYKTEAIRVEVNQFVPLSLSQEKKERSDKERRKEKE